MKYFKKKIICLILLMVCGAMFDLQAASLDSVRAINKRHEAIKQDLATLANDLLQMSLMANGENAKTLTYLYDVIVDISHDFHTLIIMMRLEAFTGQDKDGQYLIAEWINGRRNSLNIARTTLNGVLSVGKLSYTTIDGTKDVKNILQQYDNLYTDALLLYSNPN